MRNALFFAVAIAVFWIWPQESGFRGVLGSIAWFAVGLAVVTPVVVYIAIVRGLPEDVSLTPLAEFDVPPELAEPIAAYEALGFERQRSLRVDLPGNTAVLVPLVHREDGLVATAYRVDANTPRIAYDVVSMLDAPEGALTTGMDHAAGVLPAEPGMLRQIQCDAAPAELVALHRQALAALRRGGLPALDVDPAAIPALIRQSFALNRRAFFRARVANTLVALWRTLTKRNPHMEPLMQQPAAKEQIAALHRRRARASREARRTEPASA